MRTLNEYKNLFCNLLVNKRGDYVAPHKAILLLAIISLIERGDVETPFISLSKSLEKLFENIWKVYVPTSSPFTCAINYPFYHLSSSPFWKLVKLPTFVERKEYSLGALKKSFAGAMLSGDLFTLIKNEEAREELKLTLIRSYLS